MEHVFLLDKILNVEFTARTNNVFAVIILTDGTWITIIFVYLKMPSVNRSTLKMDNVPPVTNTTI